jgi:mRNA interferase RelE/StbE
MYKIELSRQARKVYLKLPEIIRKTIHEKLLRLAESPYDYHHDVKKLKGTFNCYRLRINDWRVLYHLHNATLIIEVINIGHRKEVYR